MGDMDRLKLPVNEVYGPVMQGEGPYTGRPVWFLRLGMCNLSCTWCDTPYTWDASRFSLALENENMTAEQIVKLLPERGTVVLSGGEPMMHSLNDTLQQVMANPGRQWHVETNGTIAPPTWMEDRVQHWSVSPKLSTSGDPEKKRIKPKALMAYASLARVGLAAWKFVICTEADLAEASELVYDFGIPARQVWVMAEGTTPEAQLAGMRQLEAKATDRGWNLTPRLHVLMHGDERGV